MCRYVMYRWRTGSHQALKALVRDFHFQTPGDRSRALISLIIPGL